MNNVTIKLSKYGAYLTGRTNAKKIVNALSDNLTSEDEVILDFQGVLSFAQSFCSELLFQLMERGCDLQNIQWVYVAHIGWVERVESEIEFLTSMEQASGQQTDTGNFAGNPFLPK